MSFQTLLKSASQTLGQPTGIAVIASIGLHGLVGFSWPLVSPPQKDPDRQQRTQVIELTPEQRARLPQEVLPPQTPLSNTVPIDPNALNPSLSRRIPNLSLVPYGNPSYRIPFSPGSMGNPIIGVPNRQIIWGADPRNPIAGTQQSIPVTVDPFFDNKTIQAAVPRWDVKPDADNLQIHGKPTQPSNPDPNQTPLSPDNPTPSPSPSPGNSGQPAALPDKIPTRAVEDLRKLQEQQGQLFAYDPSGVQADGGLSKTQAWTEKMLTQAGTAELKQLVIPPVYPRQARVAELSGKAVVSVLVDGNGQVIDEPELINSTGYPILDQAAIDTVASYQYPATSQPQPYLITLTFDPKQN